MEALTFVDIINSMKFTFLNWYLIVVIHTCFWNIISAIILFMTIESSQSVLSIV